MVRGKVAEARAAALRAEALLRRLKRGQSRRQFLAVAMAWIGAGCLAPINASRGCRTITVHLSAADARLCRAWMARIRPIRPGPTGRG